MRKINTNISLLRKKINRFFLFITPKDRNYRVSAVIPVLNEANNLLTLLPVLLKQKNIIMELIVVDSGSKDGSIDIAKKFNATVIHIPGKSFAHHKARNIGADAAKHEYLLFITADAMPPNDKWLSTMIKEMNRHEAAAVSCREVCKPDAEMFSKIGTWNHNRFMDIVDDDRVMKIPKIHDYENLRRNAQLNNVACVIRRRIFNKFLFRIGFAEDLDLGLRLIKEGYECALLGKTYVIHSHNRNMYYHLKRGYLDTFVLSQMFEDFDPSPIRYKDLMDELPAALKLISMTLDVVDSFRTPGRSRDLSDRVVSFMVRLRKDPSQLVLNKSIAPLFDEEFKGFVGRNIKKESPKGFRVQRNGLITSLTAAMNHNTRWYIDRNHKIVDNVLLEDYKLNLMKVFALKCGALLAASYINGSPEDKKALKNIHNELYDFKVMWKGKT